MSFEITERWLMDAGGWQAMKGARAAWQAGAVLAVEFDGTRLRGQVRAGGRTMAAGLVIKSRTDVANLCACPQSRRDGALCEHSLALGLAWVHRGPAAASAKGQGTGPGGSAAATAGREVAQAGQAGQAVPPAKASPKTSGPLLVALPPTFFNGLRRNRLALSLRPAPAGTPETAADRALHAWLASQKLASVPPQLALADRGQIESLLCALANHPAVSVASQPLAVVEDGIRLPLRVASGRKNANQEATVQKQVKNSRGVAARPTASHGSPPAPGEAAAVTLEIEPTALASLEWWSGPTRGIVRSLSDSKLFIIKSKELISPFFTESDSGQPVVVTLGWLARHGAELSEVFEVDDSAPTWPRLRLERATPAFRLALDGGLRRLAARLYCRYPGAPEFSLPMGVLQPDPFPLADAAEPGVFRERNLELEAAATARLKRSGFAYDKLDNQFVLNNEADVLQFFAGEMAALEREWSVDPSPRTKEALKGLERITPHFQEVGGGTDWLAFDLTLIGSAGSTVTAAEARRWLQTGQGTKRLANGKLAVLAQEHFADLEEVLRDLSPAQERGHFRIDRTQIGYLEASVARLGPATADAGCKNVDRSLLSKYWQKLLRNYQEYGTCWMLGLTGQGWGGILADEMGLGKTVQTLAVIATLRAAPPRPGAGPPQPCLVVAPTSLLGNWREEAARFAPELSVLVVRSGERTTELAGLGAADLVITSYQLLVRDLAHHTAVQYRAVFLDEAGFIRNPDTQSAKAVRRLRSGARFALTGTPIENSIRDLWAIMDFALPGYLGKRDDFRDRYEAPVLAGDASALDRLRRRMAPYWLRRLKQEVAKELPAKIEKIVRCELTPTQRDMYAAIQREGVRKVDEARQARSAGQARMTMLTALLRLRQTCGDPRLLGESFPDRDPAEFSAKWAALVELLEEIRDGGHSVLIFSQFATQLRLLEAAVAGVGLDFCRLDGASRDREAQVTAFRDHPAKRVFLISLKAGGFGLNLTKADTVIHFDPWWNPAVEAQATDRAHRIGQARPVTVYKLIAAGTVEEKIVALQQRKRALMESALADDAAPLMDGLDDATLDELLGS